MSPSTLRAGIRTARCPAQAGEARAIIDVVAKDQSNGIVTNEFAADDERFGEPVGLWLHRV